MLTHHAANGCNLNPGDLLGTGTISGPDPEGFGSLLEITRGGAEQLSVPGGEARTFLEDGGEVILSAHRPGGGPRFHRLRRLPRPDPAGAMNATGELVRLTATPPGEALCPLEALADPGARNFVLQIGQARFHGFVVRKGQSVLGYVDRCPHMGLPLARPLDDYLTPCGELIACGWHGALFRPEDGRCLGGPCAGQSLLAWPVAVSEGVIRTA